MKHINDSKAETFSVSERKFRQSFSQVSADESGVRLLILTNDRLPSNVNLLSSALLSLTTNDLSVELDCLNESCPDRCRSVGGPRRRHAVLAPCTGVGTCQDGLSFPAALERMGVSRCWISSEGNRGANSGCMVEGATWDCPLAAIKHLVNFIYRISSL